MNEVQIKGGLQGSSVRVTSGSVIHEMLPAALISSGGCERKVNAPSFWPAEKEIRVLASTAATALERRRNWGGSRY